MKTIAITKLLYGTLIEVKIDSNVVNTISINSPVTISHRDDTILLENNDKVLFSFDYNNVEDDLTTTNVLDYITELTTQGYFSNPNTIISMTQAEYNAITPVEGVIYVII